MNGSEVEGGEELEVAGGASSKERLWVMDLVAEVLVNLWERLEDFLMSGASLGMWSSCGGFGEFAGTSRVTRRSSDLRRSSESGAPFCSSGFGFMVGF